MPHVVSIHRVRKKGGPAESLQDATFITDFGLQDDWRSRHGRGRQITLIEAEALQAIAADLQVESIPEGASRRQVVVAGVSLNELVGRQVRLGPILVEVHDLCEPCENMERTIGVGACSAMENRGGVCGRIVEGGTLRPGDSLAIMPQA